MSDATPIRLFAYKMTDDVGFAPNPFHGMCTLATCKPQIRRYKREGDWIAGFTSKQLGKGRGRVGDERLVYLMQVATKLTFDEYHERPEYAVKIPQPAPKGNCLIGTGDNVYWTEHGEIRQVPNVYHKPEAQDHDTGGRFVLIAKRFAYFGGKPLEIPPDRRPRVPIGQAGHGVRTMDVGIATAFVDFVLGFGNGVHAAPTSWPDGDTSWDQSA